MNLLKRVTVAVVLAPIVVAAALWENPFAWMMLVLFTIFLALLEYAVIVFSVEEAWDRTFLVMMGTLMSAFILVLPRFLIEVGMWVIMVTAISAVLFSSHPPAAVVRVGKHFTGLFLIAYLMTFAGLTKQMPHGGRWLLLLLTTVWFGDTGAYFIGKTFGRHKLAPLVSPNKTWEGAIGGLFASMGAGALATLYVPDLPLMVALPLSALLGMMGQFGDLAESLVKRAYNVKDSGTLIPGHGGVWDRIDAVIFAAPILFAYLHMAYS